VDVIMVFVLFDGGGGWGGGGGGGVIHARHLLYKSKSSELWLMHD